MLGRAEYSTSTYSTVRPDVASDARKTTSRSRGIKKFVRVVIVSSCSGTILSKIVQRMRDQDVHHVRERGYIRTIFCIMTTEKARSGF